MITTITAIPQRKKDKKTLDELMVEIDDALVRLENAKAKLKKRNGGSNEH